MFTVLIIHMFKGPKHKEQYYCLSLDLQLYNSQTLGSLVDLNNLVTHSRWTN
jgi:hypothetical protein